jgi:anti-sigma factor RsiW
MAELVTDYLEGDLPWQRRLAARVHLFICTACTRYFDQMRKTVRLLRSAPTPVLPAGREEALIQSVTAVLPPPASG